MLSMGPTQPLFVFGEFIKDCFIQLHHIVSSVVSESLAEFCSLRPVSKMVLFKVLMSESLHVAHLFV